MCIQRVSDWLLGNESTLQEIPPLREVAEQALKEWQDAIVYFNTVTDDDLVAYASFAVKAAERKYIYLWKLLRVQHEQNRANLFLVEDAPDVSECS